MRCSSGMLFLTNRAYAQLDNSLILIQERALAALLTVNHAPLVLLAKLAILIITSIVVAEFVHRVLLNANLVKAPMIVHNVIPTTPGSIIKSNVCLVHVLPISILAKFLEAARAVLHLVPHALQQLAQAVNMGTS